MDLHLKASDFEASASPTSGGRLGAGGHESGFATAP